MAESKTEQKAKHAGGRPTLYSQELVNRICEQIITGKSLRTICKAADMPTASSVFLWLSKHPEFSEQYTHACEERTEAHVEEIFDIADDGRNDWMEDQRRGKTVTVVNQEALQRSKLRADVRMWYAAKMKPKKYGTQRIEQETNIQGGIELKWKDDDLD